MHRLLQKCLKFNIKLDLNFEGGELTSDAGLLLYREFDDKLGFSQCIKENFHIQGDDYYRVHHSEEIILQKVYQSLAGYFTDDCADALANEPLFNQILAKDRLASQPTLSRLNSRLTADTVTQLENICDILQERILAYERPEHMILDLDSTHFNTYGNQEKTDFNYHYLSTGYHPLLMFDGLTGDLLKAELRAGNVYTSKDVVPFIQPFLNKYDKHHPEIDMYVRGDSGFAVPELYEVLEEMNYKYAIRLKYNKNLGRLVSKLDEEFLLSCKEDMISYKVMYAEIEYQAGSWSKARKVAVKIEKQAGELVPMHTFIVSNMGSSPREIVKFYCNRGTMENFIKEGKNSFEFDKMSSPNFVVNSNKLQISMLAYNFNNWFRRLCVAKDVRSFRMETIRSKIIKVAARVVHHARRITFKLCSSYPYKDLFCAIMDQMDRLPLLE